MLQPARFHLLIIAFLFLSLRSSRLRGEIRWAWLNNSTRPPLVLGHLTKGSRSRVVRGIRGRAFGSGRSRAHC